MPERQYSRHLPRPVATNPVAQAVAKQELHSAAIHYRAMAYLLDEGTECMSMLQHTAFIVMVACTIDPHDNRMPGTMGALAQMSKTGRWNKINAVSVELGLGLAVATIQAAKAGTINNAVKVVQRGESRTPQVRVVGRNVGRIGKTGSEPA